MKLMILVCLSLIASVASLAPTAHAQTFSVIHTFTGVGEDGAFPEAGVTERAGALYGTTSGGGISGVFGFGSVYQMTPTGAAWAYTPIFPFPEDGYIGYDPIARVVFGPDHHLYGTTFNGGIHNGGGTVFSLTPPPSICKTVSCPWSSKLVWSFNAFDTSGGDNPGSGDLLWDEQGNIYGPTAYGGNPGLGVIYELSPSGNGWQETVLYTFTDLPDGRIPFGGLIFDPQGNLWGTTAYGGPADQGTIFKLTHTPGAGWQETIVYSLQNNDGEAPMGGLVMDSSGNFYGTASDLGSGVGGTVFELSPSGDSYTFKVLYSFSGYYGCGPQAGLTLDSAGNLYGTTRCDGAYQSGNVFKLTNNNGWVYTSLYDFTGGSDGNQPYSNVTIGTDGTLYGTAERGGSFEGDCGKAGGCGVVWQIKP